MRSHPMAPPARLLALIAVLFSATASPSGTVDTVAAVLQSSFVWGAAAPPGSYVAFRRTFVAPTTLDAPFLAVFADSRYTLWINGARIADGPTRFDWRSPEYDVVPLKGLLTPGAQNSVVLVAHNYVTCAFAGGVVGAAPANIPEVCPVADPNTWWLSTPSGRFQNHVPGATAAIYADVNATSPLIVTDASWRASAATRYTPSPAAWGSVPDAIDGRVDNGTAAWLDTAFDDSAWPAAAPLAGSAWGALSRRPTPSQRQRALPPPTIVSPPGGAWPIVLTPAKPTAVLDLGAQALARFDVELAASAPGLGLALSWWERRNASGGLSHGYWTSTYAAAGTGAPEAFSTLDVFGGRYVQLSLLASNASAATAGGGAQAAAVTVSAVRGTDVRYPLALVGAFDAPSDPFLGRLFSMAAATIAMNTADSYTDCSTRERVEWIGDATINIYNGTRTAFATVEDDGAVTYADHRLLYGVLKRAALSGRAPYPSMFQVKAHTCSDRLDFNAVWTDQTLAWASAFARYLAVSGDVAGVAALWPDLRAALAAVVARTQALSGLGLHRETIFFSDPLFLQVLCSATMNSFAYVGLADGASVAASLAAASAAGALPLGPWHYAADAALFGNASAGLRRNLVATLWNESAGAFNAAVLGDADAIAAGGLQPFGASYYGTMVAVAKGVLDDDPTRLAAAQAFLTDPANAPATAALEPMPAIQQLAALYRPPGSAVADALALDVMRTNWAAMVSADDVGTLWEMFDDSGEVCHNMGAAPLPFLLERVLGVSATLPLTLHTVSIEPHLGGLPAAAGVVGTELGPLGVAWGVQGGPWSPPWPRTVDAELNATAGAGLTLRVALPLDDPATPPPPSAAALAAYCLDATPGGGPTTTTNVSEALAAGALTLDASRRFLRGSWEAAAAEAAEKGGAAGSWGGGPVPPGVDSVASLRLRLYAPQGGGSCSGGRAL